MKRAISSALHQYLESIDHAGDADELSNVVSEAHGYLRGVREREGVTAVERDEWLSRIEQEFETRSHELENEE